MIARSGGVRLFFLGLLLVLPSAVAPAAALVTVPTQAKPSVTAGLEPNKGQANSGILFLARGNGTNTAVSPQSILYSPIGATLNLLASNPNPTVSFSNPLPGLVNTYTGADPRKWFTGIPRYTTVSLTAVLPGIDAQYKIGSDGVLTLSFLLAAGVDPKLLQFQMAGIGPVTVVNGSLIVGGRFGPILTYPVPIALQGSGAGQVSRSVNFDVQSATTFGLVVQGLDATQPLQISIQVTGASVPYFSGTLNASDAAGRTFIATGIADAAGKTAPFPNLVGVGCGNAIGQPFPCSDVVIAGYSTAGVLNFITYLAGATDENSAFVGLAPGGALVVAGTTDSVDFPVTAGAVQTVYAGPAPHPASSSSDPIRGDFFAAILDPATGQLRSSTFLGGPNADTMGAAALGTDGSLYFLPKFVGIPSAGMPVTSGALQPSCQGDPCQSSYVARLSPPLDRLIFGTYLPGMSQATAQLHSDGSVYYAGTATSGFPTTPGAYQANNAGGFDGIIARLDSTGNRLLSATYFGGLNTDWILAIAVAPDGSVWANVSSFIQCCINIQPHLTHFDANFSRLLANLPLDAVEMVVNAAGDLIALATGSVAVSADSILGGSCGGPAYVELSPNGQQLFATYLPYGYEIEFDGADAQGTPYLNTPAGRVRIAKDQAAPPSAGCVVDAPSFSNGQVISPGAIVTIFGSSMGPSQGVGYQLVNGRVPLSLGGTQVLVNGTPAPILYSSYGQINLILPYSLDVGTKPTIQVVINGTPLNVLSTAVFQPAGISFFQMNGAAVALNQDYSLNSPQNPARPGSTVMLFGSGGGQTNPPSVAGEVTPLELRPLVSVPQVLILDAFTGSTSLDVQYAGAAPSLISGVTQINVTLPNSIHTVTGYPPGTLPFYVTANGTDLFSGAVTISVSVN